MQRGFLTRLTRSPMGAIGLGRLLVSCARRVRAPVVAVEPDAHPHVRIEDIYQPPPLPTAGNDDGGNDVLSALITGPGCRDRQLRGLVMTILIGGTRLGGGYRVAGSARS